nr:restriction system-associated AAA family ATPase [uncultured Carboxylicivirga sp.]
MEIVRIKIYSEFRGLQPEFEIKFKNNFNRNEIDPICFAGLNGSGKSNVMELISEIFFYLESINNLSAKKYIKTDSNFGFLIEYLIPLSANNLLQNEPGDYVKNGLTRNVTIKKYKHKPPIITYKVDGEKEVQLIKKDFSTEDYYIEAFDKILPSKVVAYSSGGNEQISKPFQRMGFFYFDEFERATNNIESIGTTRLNRLYLMDYKSNASVLLTNFLFKDNVLEDNLGFKINKELEYMKDVVDVEDIHSFKLVFNLDVKKDHSYSRLKDKIEELTGSSEVEQLLESFKSLLFQKVSIPIQLQSFITNLIYCSTTQKFTIDNDKKDINPEKDWIKLTLYFHVDMELKRAFQETFRKSKVSDFFQNLYLLDLLNINNYSVELREDAKKAGLGKNIAEMLPEIIKEDKVFYISDVRLKKKSDKTDIFYKSLSDGEHQFIQIVGTLLLMEEEGTIFILDEPSTHFNADWSSKFFSTLNDIYLMRKERIEDKSDRKRQNVILSTHSPIMLSDCKTKNVVWFERKNGTTATKELEFETYGASVDYIMKMLSDKNVLIPDKARKELEAAIESDDINTVRKAISKFGESSEKQFLFSKLYELKQKPE